MRHTQRFSLLALACLWAGLAAAQIPFNNCSAAFLGGKMLVNEYSPEGKCVLSKEDIGTLTLSTVYLAPDTSKAVDPLRFMLAIRDGNTKTMVMYSTQILTEVPVQDVLRVCKPGDSIVLLTLEYTYALPHNEILVQE
jgi:hypothetical protein